MHEPDEMPQIVVLCISLAVLWLLLSGHYSGLLLSLGLFSLLLVALISVRMDVADKEGQPFHLNPLKLLAYWVWLLAEILKANIAVCRIILQPRLSICPSVLRLKSDQGSVLGRVLYANSITLTPGTVAINLSEDEVEVHALTQEAAANLLQGEMNRRAQAVERKGAA